MKWCNSKGDGPKFKPGDRCFIADRGRISEGKVLACEWFGHHKQATGVDVAVDGSCPMKFDCEIVFHTRKAAIRHAKEYCKRMIGEYTYRMKKVR